MKFKFPMIALVMAVTCGVCGCAQDGKKDPTAKEQATAQWNQARAGVLASLAKSQYESGDLEKSQQTVSDAMRLTPNDATLHVLAGRICIEQGKLESAEAELSFARKLDNKNAEAEYLSGIVYQRWQKPEQAYECYLRASQKDPKELAYMLARSEMLVAMNCTNEALALLKAQIENFEHSAELYHAIGQLQSNLGHYPEAVEALQQASLLGPDDLKIREHLAMAMFQNHQYRPANDIYVRLLKDPSNAKRSELWVALGECQMQLNRTSEARASFDKATQFDVESTAAWLSVAKAELQLNDTRQAETALRKVMALDPSCAEAHLMLGYARVRQNRMSDALYEFQKASALDGTDPVSLCMIGYVLEKTGKSDQAMKYYTAALKLKPNDELASRLMASVDVGN